VCSHPLWWQPPSAGRGGLWCAAILCWQGWSVVCSHPLLAGVVCGVQPSIAGRARRGAAIKCYRPKPVWCACVSDSVVVLCYVLQGVWPCICVHGARPGLCCPPARGACRSTWQVIGRTLQVCPPCVSVRDAAAMPIAPTATTHRTQASTHNTDRHTAAGASMYKVCRCCVPPNPAARPANRCLVNPLAMLLPSCLLTPPPGPPEPTQQRPRRRSTWKTHPS